MKEAGMAQMVARRIGNAEVTGSIPVASFFSILHYINIIADMAELADAPDLGSGGQPCRFDSCHPQAGNIAVNFKVFQ